MPPVKGGRTSLWSVVVLTSCHLMTSAKSQTESPVFWIIVTLNTLNKEMVFKHIWLYVYLDVRFLGNLICYGFSVGRNRCILSIQGLLGYEAGTCTVWVYK